ncbi:MAG: SURF1 family protein [Nocardioidaceae bacterium]
MPVPPLLAPRLWGLHVLAVLATTAAVLLGIWQYDAWGSRRDDQATSLADAPAKPLSRVMSADDPFPGDAVGQPVELQGRWLTRSTIYVADRALHGRRGVWAVTPVEVCGTATSCAGASAVLVVRGWTPTVAAAPAPPTGRVAVTGWLQPGEGSGTTDPDPTDDVIPELRIADAIQHVDQDLYGGYVIAKRISTSSTNGSGSTIDGGLEAVTPASLPQAETFTALRNLLYAIEWWVFGGFAVFIWWRWCRDELERQRIEREGPDGEPDEEAAPQVSGVTGVASGP